MSTFESLELNGAVLRGIERAGYSEPTPIQAKLIPQVMAGRDAIGLSQTGSGKTGAFILPILHQIAEEEQSAGPGHCRGLVVAPTRELAMQIVDNARALSRFSKANIALLIGGTGYGPQINAMKRGADLVIATPGRLIDHLESGYLSLHRTHVIVLDEADQMMDMGFLPSMRKIMQAMPEKRQTLLLTATMPKPIRKLASDFLRKPVEIETSPQSKPVERIEQHVFAIKSRDRRRALLALVEQYGINRGIVFTRTKRTADSLEKLLRQAGIKAFALHGDKSKGERNRALTAFKKAEVPLLVATDIAARGIDVDSVGHVINYEMPHVPESYVHRVGRTARAGKEGVALSLCAPAEQPLLKDIQRLTGLKLSMEQLRLDGAELPDKDAPPVAVEPEGGARAPKKANRKRDRAGAPAQGAADRRQDRARPPKKSAWNPIRARVEDPGSGDATAPDSSKPLKKKKKSGTRKPKVGNHRKGQPRPAGSGEAKAGRTQARKPARNGSSGNPSGGKMRQEARAKRDSQGRAKGPGEAAA